MTQPIDKLLLKKVTRKEFMLLLGAGTISMTGLSALIPALTSTTENNSKATKGYGSGSFSKQ